MLNRRGLVAGTAVLALHPFNSLASLGNPRNRRKKGGRDRARSADSVAQVDAVLGPLAELMWHGEADDKQSVEKLVNRIAHGERVMIQCTNQAKIAVRVLAHAGIQARMINPFYSGAWESSWSHTSMEVRVAGRWMVFDPTGNAQLVDQDGQGLDVSSACLTRPLLTRPFAFDALWGWEGAPDDLQSYYERIFQIPVIQHQHLWRFHDEENRQRIEGMGRAWQWANSQEWEKLIR